MSTRWFFAIVAVGILLMAYAAKAEEQAPPLGIPPVQATKQILCWPSKLFDREFQFYQAEGEAWLAQDGKYLYQFYASPAERVLVFRDAVGQMSCVVDFENLGDNS